MPMRGVRLGVPRRFVAGVIVLALAVVWGCGSSSLASSAGTFKPAHPRTLTVATAFLPAPGFWEGDTAAPSGGFERDLAYALAKRFGLPSVAVVPVVFGDLVAGHLDGADVALSELTPTAERGKVLDFTTPYLVAPPGVVVRPGNSPRDLAALRGLRWVTVTGSTLTRVVDDVIQPDQRALQVVGRPDALAAIDRGEAQAMLLDLPVALALARSMPDRYKVAAQLSGSEGLAAALPHGSKNSEAVDSAIRAFLADGTISRLSKRWLGADLTTQANDVPLIRTHD
jgi:polar amino acid transport system substrate-binding protein